MAYGDRNLKLFVEFIKRTDTPVWAGCIDEVLDLLDEFNWNIEEAIDDFFTVNFGENYHSNPIYIDYLNNLREATTPEDYELKRPSCTHSLE